MRSFPSFKSAARLIAVTVAAIYIRSMATLAGEPPVAQAGAAATEAPVSAATPVNAVRLAYKFRPGQFVHYSGTSRVQYHAQLEDKTFISQQTNETGSHFRVVTVDERGLALIEPVLDRTRMTAKVHDQQPVVFDSTTGAVPQPQFQAIRDAIGRAVARFQVGPDGRLVKAIIVDPAAPQSLRDAAEKLETRFPFLALLPGTPVAVGDKWREEYSSVVVNEGLKQPIPLRRIYELTAVADGIATIKFKTLVLTPLNEPELEKQLIQQTPAGTIEFDVEQGLVRSHSSSINRSTINAFGPRTVLQVVGESTETLVTPAASISAVTR